MEGLELVEGREEELEEAVLELEERVRGILVKALGHTASQIDVVVSLSHEAGRPVRLEVEVRAYRRGVEDLDALVEAAIHEAVREFERRLGLNSVKARRHAKESRRDGHNNA